MNRRCSERWAASATFGLILLAGCGTNPLPVVPDDCAFFNRAQARAWYGAILSQKNDGATQLAATAVIVQQCASENCDGTTLGACAVSCAACADALATIAYE